MADYSQQTLAAYSALLKKGQLITITRKTPGTYDPVMGTTAVTTAEETGYGLPRAYTIRETDGTTIQRGDTLLILSASGISKPQTNDTVVVSGDTLTIKSVIELSPGGDAIIYKCQLRK